MNHSDGLCNSTQLPVHQSSSMDVCGYMQRNQPISELEAQKWRRHLVLFLRANIMAVQLMSYPSAFSIYSILGWLMQFSCSHQVQTDNEFWMIARKQLQKQGRPPVNPAIVARTQKALRWLTRFQAQRFPVTTAQTAKKMKLLHYKWIINKETSILYLRAIDTPQPGCSVGRGQRTTLWTRGRTDRWCHWEWLTIDAASDADWWSLEARHPAKRGGGSGGLVCEEASAASPFTVTDWGSMSRHTGADWGPDASVAVEGCEVSVVGWAAWRAAGVSRAKLQMLWSPLKGGRPFHWRREDAAAALLKQQRGVAFLILEFSCIKQLVYSSNHSVSWLEAAVITVTSTSKNDQY